MKDFFIYNKKKQKLHCWKQESCSNLSKNIVVCFFHGIGEYGGRYRKLADYYSNHGIISYAIDLPGHGLSYGKRGDCSPRKCVIDDMETFIDYVLTENPESSLILYGHSMGGNLVLDYRRKSKMKKRIKGYVVSAPWIKLAGKISFGRYLVYNIASILFPTKTVNSSYENKSADNTLLVEKSGDKNMCHSKISLRTVMDGYRTGMEIYKESLETDNDSTPILIMHGTEDRKCSIDGSIKFKNLHKDICEYVQWEGAGHNLHNCKEADTYTKVAALTLKWIEDIGYNNV